MRILINTLAILSSGTGIGKCTYYIAKKLKEIDNKNSYYYYYGYYSQKILDIRKFLFLQSTLDKFRKLIRKMPFVFWFKKLAYYFMITEKFEFDIYFEPNFVLLEKIKAKKRIVFVYDFSFDLYPEWHPDDRVLYLRENFWRSIKRADRVILPSNFIYEEAVNKFNFEKSILRIVYLGVDQDIFKKYPTDLVEKVCKKYRLPKNFILFVGSIEPRKNLRNLLLAYELLPPYIKNEFSLVLVGFSGWKNENIMKIIKKNQNRIIYTGYVPENELALIYNKASVFVFPSFYEGFGLPPLEAMACGCPVIVSNTGSLPEICGNAALYCNPYDPQDIAKAIYELIKSEDFRNYFIEKGLERVKFFLWDKTAEGILKIMEEIL